MRLGTYFRDARKKAGLSQSQVAKALGYTTSQFVSNWERNKRGVPLRKFKKVCKMYQLDQRAATEVLISHYREYINSRTRQ